MTSETFSLFGDQLLGVALPLYVYDHLGGAPAAAAIVLARVVPLALLGLLGGVLADRVDRRRLLVVTGLLRTLLVLGLLAVGSGGLPLAIVLVMGLAAIGQLAGPAVGASLPAIVSPEDLPSANAQLAARTVVVSLIAPTLGAVLYAGTGLGTVVLVNTGLYLLSAVVASLLVLTHTPRDERSGWLPDLRAGLQVVTGDLLLRRLLLVVAVAMFGLAVEMAVLVPFVRSVLEGSPRAVGVLTSFHAAGGLVGAVLVPVLARRRDAKVLIHIGIVGLPVAALGFLASQQVWQAVPGLVLAGLLVTVLSAGAQTYLQRTVAPTHVGRVLGIIASAFGVASMAGTGLAVLLTHLLSLRECLGVAAALEVLAVALWAAQALRLRARTPALVE